MTNFKNKPIFGMIHLAGGDDESIINRAIDEIDIYIEHNIDACIIENYHGSVDDIINVLRALSIIKKRDIKIGINILPNEYEQAFEMADKYGASFIQLDYVAGKYERSKEINEEHYLSIKNKYPNIKVLGGIWPKYYIPVKGSILKADIEIGMKRAESITCTGEGTGKQTPIEKIKEFRNILGEFPLIIGAGLNPSNVVEQLSIADGGIVGSTFKPYGRTQEKIQRSLVKEFMDEVKKIR